MPNRQEARRSSGERLLTVSSVCVIINVVCCSVVPCALGQEVLLVVCRPPTQSASGMLGVWWEGQGLTTTHAETLPPLAALRCKVPTPGGEL